MGLPRPREAMTADGGPTGPVGAGPDGGGGPAVEGDGRPGRGATQPERPAVQEKAAEVERPSSWRNLWWNLWRGLAGPPSAGPAGDANHAPAAPPADAPGPFRLRVGVVSTVGNYREHNEDNFYLPSPDGKAIGGGTTGQRDAFLEVRLDPGAILPFVVADGMGGQLAGEKASQMAVDIIPKELSRRIGPGESEDKAIQRVIRDAVAAANQEILGLSVVQTEFNNMGTTVVLALFRADRVYVAGIGDSRAYRVRDGRIEQFTKDHSLAQALLEAGTITAEELPNHKFNHVLYLYLGSKDARGGPEDVRAAEFRVGDRFLLASDGLTGVVDDERLAEVVAASDDPQVTARALVTLALDNHSKDNVTCLVIHVV